MKTYIVTLEIVVDGNSTDPSEWDYDTLLDPGPDEYARVISCEKREEEEG